MPLLYFAFIRHYLKILPSTKNFKDLQISCTDKSPAFYNVHVNGSIFSVGKFWKGPWTRHWNGVRSHNHNLGLSRVSLCSSWKIDKLKVVRLCLANIICLEYRLFELICLKPSYFKLENLTNRLFGKFNPIKLKKKLNQSCICKVVT